MKMFNINDMHIVRNCQMYFNFDMPSTLWAKCVRTFNEKFSASNNMFCKATESKHAQLRTSCDFAVLKVALLRTAAYLAAECYVQVYGCMMMTHQQFEVA